MEWNYPGMEGVVDPLGPVRLRVLSKGCFCHLGHFGTSLIHRTGGGSLLSIFVIVNLNCNSNDVISIVVLVSVKLIANN